MFRRSLTIITAVVATLVLLVIVVTAPRVGPIHMAKVAARLADLGPVQTQRSYPGVGIILEVPDSAPPAAMRAADVLASCKAKGGCMVFEGDSQAELAVVTDRMYTSAGSPVINKVLAYVFTWKGQPCAIFGLVNTSPPSVPWLCDKMILIDANTGTYLLAVETNPSP